MIRKIEGATCAFELQTANTTYLFAVRSTGQLEHIYYGSRIQVSDVEALKEQHCVQQGNSIAYTQDDLDMTLEDLCLEMSGYGKGDIREPLVEVVCYDGSSTTDFVYESSEITQGKAPFETLPGSYDEENRVEHLCVTMKDQNQGFHLELHYYVYEAEDVITRSTKFINDSAHPVSIRRLLSTCVDFNEADFTISSFHGNWIKEMQKKDVVLTGGTYVNATYAGWSSNRSNPFVMASRPGCDEWSGECFGFNLIYSGNHYEAFEVSSFDKTRFVSGINPRNFAYGLAEGESLEAPEAVMTYSAAGHNGMSQNLHRFVRKHIVRGMWRDKERPVLLNSWEANYFEIDEGKLVALAKKGKEAGVELFVMDDGWFGNRSDDKRALGDWRVNTKKLPNGLKGLADKINALGLSFGIWVEPEMINVDSDLYRAHPDWALQIPGKPHSEGRNQRILDFCNPEVVDCMMEQMRQVFSSANIAYVKWDMNRIWSDYYSPYLPAEKQQEVNHRYIVGMYRMMKTLTQEFPQILFEGCASGGNRFDLGMLCYFPQIWGSDNSDAISRLSIQNGYSYGYPMSAVTAHVSACPNHQTLRNTPLSSRFHVASYGVLGYECNFCDMKKEELEAIAVQIATYKKHRRTMQYGSFYRLRSDNVYQWMVVSEDRKDAVGMMLQREVMPNEPYMNFRAKGLDANRKYHFYSTPFQHNIKTFGSLVNAVAPVHVKQDGLLHRAMAQVIKIDGEVEDATLYGDALMQVGKNLKQGFASSGFNNEVRVMTDFASRMYFMEAEE
ncbi:MAG: alpha-galactosidase [Lachnospiraceae bacterium]|nr:alpha-galactosidase [Lachnospiraceae bacterium]